MFFERPESGELAVLVHIDFPEGDDREDPREFEELVLSAGVDPAMVITGSRQTPHPKTFIGSGKLEEVRDALLATDAKVVLFNHALSPSQERNIEKILECRVLDRTGLILDIFAQRARTHEGKLQVELAQLQHQSTRLIRGWTHLERQKGGIGMRGPGETQLETDRRLLRGRIKSIHKRLAKVQTQREQGRRARSRSSTPTVSIVGYTNAGKSSLFNTLTQADVYAANQMFATLDPTLRKLNMPDIGDVVLADTVGFIRHLPHKLVESFKATLQETTEADLLLHVIDSADPERNHNIDEVENVLAEIEANEIPTLQIFNKIDLLTDNQVRIDRDEHGKPWRIWVSAKSGEGMVELQQCIGELLGEDVIHETIDVSPQDARLRALLYDQQAIVHEGIDDQGHFQLEIRLQKQDFKQLLARAGIPEFKYLAPDKESWH